MRRALLPALAAVAMAVGLWFALASPPDRLQGDYVRIMYVHVPSAWLAFFAFGVTAFGSLMWLLRRQRAWDRLAASSAEVGVVFTAITLFTGMIWGGVVWGTYWSWSDARLTTTALMFFVYLGYLGLRRATPEPEARARRAAILGMVAVVQVPLVYFSVNLWRTLHQPQSIRPDGASMPGAMVQALLVNLAAFTVLYLALLVSRMRLARVEEAEELRTGPAGAAVSPPRLSEAADG